MSPMDTHRRDRHTKSILFLTLSTVITSNQTMKCTENSLHGVSSSLLLLLPQPSTRQRQQQSHHSTGNISCW